MYKKYFKILGIQPDSSDDEIKKAYYKAAKKNHPDAFPGEKSHYQHLQMMKINEAYMCLLSSKNNNITKQNISNNEFIQTKVPSKDLGSLKDPAYTYYKLGFDFYNKGQATFHKKVKHRGVTDFKSYIASREDAQYGPSGQEILNRATKSLHYFEQSYEYFLEVITKYSTSPWYADALSKINDLEKLNEVYIKIFLNMSKEE